MRKIFMLGASVCLMACGSVKRMPTSDQKIVFTSGCDARVTCMGTIHDGKGLKITLNEEGTYDYSLVDNQHTTVFILRYSRDMPKEIQDGQYREEFIFEIPGGKIPVNIKLNKASKAVFGRFCYCKGATGYYPVNAGQLSIEMENGKLTGHVKFDVSVVPQIWKETSFVIQ